VTALRSTHGGNHPEFVEQNRHMIQYASVVATRHEVYKSSITPRVHQRPRHQTSADLNSVISKTTQNLSTTQICLVAEYLQTGRTLHALNSMKQNTHVVTLPYSATTSGMQNNDDSVKLGCVDGGTKTKTIPVPTRIKQCPRPRHAAYPFVLWLMKCARHLPARLRR